MISGINVTPLVDIVLVLLLVFMVTAKLVSSPAVPLDLPRAVHTQAVQTVFAVRIVANGELRADGRAIGSDHELIAVSRAAYERHPDARVVIEAAGSVPHRRIIHILDLLRDAGFSAVAFAAIPDLQPEQTR